LLAGKQPDTRMELAEQLVANSLWLRDLGYFGIEDFKKIVREKANYISRLRSDVNVYLSKEKEAKPVDLAKLAKKLKANEVLDLEVFLARSCGLFTQNYKRPSGEISNSCMSDV
jgi:hypothetical protein